MAYVKIEGAKELGIKLLQLEKAVAEEILEASVDAGARVIEADARVKAPVRTGQLKRSITRETTVRGRTQTMVDVGPSKKGFYGLFLEFGTSTMSAQPFLRPAFDESKDEALRVITEMLRVSVLKVASLR